MRIISIEYSNYRCFNNEKLVFDGKHPNKINLIVGPNGGGKTEILYSFWWVLYGFNFKNLQGKEDAPFSLNIQKYKNLENSTVGTSLSSKVILKFVDEDKSYAILKEEEFIKKNGGIVNQVKRFELASKSLTTGESAVKINDANLIYSTISRIIPKRILSGILFDGERMKKLSGTDTDSIEAIKGIINIISNEELMQICNEAIDKCLQNVNKDEKRILTITSNNTLDSVNEKIESLTQHKKIIDDQLNAFSAEKEKMELTISEIESEILKDETAREHEKRRDVLKAEKSLLEEQYEKHIENFYTDLYDGYLLLCKQVCTDAKSTINSVFIPDELTVPAVKSILKSGTCICGNKITEKEKASLEDWIRKLPPGNIGSAISEMASHALNSKDIVYKKYAEDYKNIKDFENRIKSIKDELAIISSQLTGDDVSKKVNQLEIKLSDIKGKRYNLNDRINSLKNELSSISLQLEKLNKEKAEKVKNDSLLSEINKRHTVLDRFSVAMKEIKHLNEMYAFESLNEKIDSAYRRISEDYDSGRRLYIVQFDRDKKYRIVSYLANNYDKSFLEKQNVINALKMQGKSDEEIKEKLILDILEPNSTGQRKINSLAFAKSILDFSVENREGDMVAQSKDYPLLIDAPFTELADGNLNQTAEFINTFAKQIIIFTDDVTYESVRDKLDKHVCKKMFLHKDSAKSCSTISEEF